MSGPVKHVYEFGPFRLDPPEHTLWREGRRVPLRPKVFDVLLALVERHGHLVEKDELMRAIWPDQFVEDGNLNKTVSMLRQALGGEDDGPYVETVPKLGYRFLADVRIANGGEPDFAATERTRTSLIEEAKDDGTEATSHQPLDLTAVKETPPAADTVQLVVRPTGRTEFLGKSRHHKTVEAAAALVLLVGIGLTYLAANRYRNDEGASGTKSIAVLPLKPINAASRDEIYEIGIADSLIHRLSSLKGFFVRPLTATRKYTDIAQDPLAAGREQQVDYVLASNYQLSGGKIRVTAQLVGAASGEIEETTIVEEDTGDIFAAQDAIASEVATVLLRHFGATSGIPAPHGGTNNKEAYWLYLQGTNFTSHRSPKDAAKAVEYFEQAVRRDPRFARAYAGMAHAHLLSVLGSGGLTAEDRDKIKRMIDRALALDSNLAEAYAARADLTLKYEWDFPAVERDLLRALELEPTNESAHWLHALLSAYRGHFHKALEEIETAQAVNPGALMYMRDRGRILYYARRYGEAAAQLNRVIDLDENFETAYWWLWRAYEFNGDEARAYETFIQRQKRMNPDRVEMYQKAYATSGWHGVNRKRLEVSKLNEDHPEMLFVDAAGQCALLGEKDKAFDYLNKAVEKRQWAVIMLKVDPALDSLREDPRFAELAGRVGLK